MLHALRPLPCVLLALSLSAAGSPAQEWLRRPFFRQSVSPELVHDSARNRTVYVRPAPSGGANVWEWDGSAWNLPSAAGGPNDVVRHAMAYDSRRHRLVLLAGRTGAFTDELWEWDGVQWERRPRAVHPPGRINAAMVFDSARGQAVVFGGYGGFRGYPIGSGVLSDTWGWDGTRWVDFRPDRHPPARSKHAMAYDSTRRRVVLFGGWDVRQRRIGDTWEWDGTTWTQCYPAVAPTARRNHRMAYDAARGCTVLFGGFASLRGATSTAALSTETWEWDGTTWTERLPTLSPPTVDMPAMTYDEESRRVVLLADGVRWEWDGTTWTRGPGPFGPQGSVSNPRVPMAEDAARRRIVTHHAAIDGIPLVVRPETWEWNGSSWEHRQPPTTPPWRIGAALSSAAGGSGVVQFGGGDCRLCAFGAANCSRLHADTWVWDGTTWNDRTPASSPPARAGMAMAYDSGRDRVVLFGGLSAGRTLLADTWEWDGTTWRQISSPAGPVARACHAMAYDRRRRRVVLFGGAIDPYLHSTGGLADTWEWDGTTWLQRQPALSPPARRAHAMAYDDRLGRVVVFGGEGNGGGATFRQDTWEWDGSTWERRVAAEPPPADVPGGMAYDSRRGHLVMLGTHSDQVTWLFGRMTSADVATYGAGCAGDGGVPVLATNGLPLTGSRSFALDVVSAPASAPVSHLLSRRAGHLGLVGGCTLLVDPGTLVAAVATLSNTAGFTSLRLPVPPSPSLLGAELFAQAAPLDPTRPAGHSLTNGLRIRVGY